MYDVRINTICQMQTTYKAIISCSLLIFKVVCVFCFSAFSIIATRLSLFGYY